MAQIDDGWRGTRNHGVVRGEFDIAARVDADRVFNDIDKSCRGSHMGYGED